MKKTWIFGNFLEDFFKLWGLGFLVFAFMSFYQTQQGLWLLSLIAYVFIDSGHVYTTAFRTYFKTDHIEKTFIYAPLLLFTIVFIWSFSGTPFLWSTLIYFTFYHNTRQHYGVLTWHTKINNSKKPSTWLFYLLLTLPFIGFHFRDISFPEIYGGKPLFLLPNVHLYEGTLLINLILLFGFILLQWVRSKNDRLPSPVFYSFLFPSLLNFACFCLAPNFNAALVPLLIVHGVSYFCLTEKVLLSAKRSSYKPKITLISIFLIAIVTGSAEWFFTEKLVDLYPSELYRFNFLQSILVGLILVPTLSHYIFDGIIWKSSNKEFRSALHSN